MITIQDMVQREINCCMSGLVATLAAGNHGITEHPSRGPDMPLRVLSEQAFELTRAIPDYEEAAIQAGWIRHDMQHAPDAPWFAHDKQKTQSGNPVRHMHGSWQELCEAESIEPYAREVFEHWAVSDWLADKLIAKGEKVDKDFADLCIWARTTTGHAIYADGVIEAIYREAMSA